MQTVFERPSDYDGNDYQNDEFDIGSRTGVGVVLLWSRHDLCLVFANNDFHAID